MKTKIYSFYSDKKNTYVNVKAQSKKNVIKYAEEILGDKIQSSSISILNSNNSHQMPIEEAHSEIF